MKIALITGASSGMGREIIRQLHKHFQVDEIWAVARRKDRLEELEKLTPFTVVPVEADLSEKTSLIKIKDLLEEKKPEISLLVNCAGFGKIGKVEEIPLNEQLGMLEVNCSALTAVTNISLPHMKEGGRIMQFASVAAFLPQPKFAVYAASKSYVLSFSRALNSELRERKIKVCAICPGPVKTEFFTLAESTGKLAAYKTKFMAPADKVVKKALKAVKKGRQISVYGFTMKFLHLITKILPQRLVLAFFK